MESKGSWFSWERIKKFDSILVSVSLGHGVLHWYPGTFYIVLPFLAKDLGLTYSQVGILMGWNYFANFFVNMPGGMIVDIVGKTGLLLGMSLALSGIPYFFLGFSGSFVVVLLLITFVGIGAMLWHPAAISLLAKRYPQHKGFAIAVHAMGANLGDTVAPMAIGVSLTFLIWRQVLLLNVLPGIIMGFILWKLLIRGETVRVEGKEKGLSLLNYWTAVKTLVQNKSIMILCALSGMRAMTQTGLFTFLPLYLANELKYSPALVGTYITILQAAGIFSAPISGFISDKKGRRPVLTAGLFTTSLLLVALVVLRLNFLFIGVLAFLGFFLFSLRPVMFAWTMDLAPKDVGGTTVSAVFSLQFLFSAMAPVLCGFIADRFGILYTFYFLAFTIFSANILVFLIPVKASEEEVPLVGEEL